MCMMKDIPRKEDGVPRHSGWEVGRYLSLGIALGLLFGAAIGNIPLGLLLGLSLGVLAGRFPRRENDSDRQDRAAQRQKV